MSKQVPAPTSKGLAPIKPGFIEAIRRDAQTIGWGADELSRQVFNRDLEALTVEEGVKFSGQVCNEINEGMRGPKADGPHTVECVGCHNSYRCFCSNQHKQGECYYCHNNTTQFYTVTH
jgi:hypothetical protein